MDTGHFHIPRTSAFVLANATVPVALVEGTTLAGDPDGLATIDMAVDDGRITGLAPSGSALGGGFAVVDMARRTVLPGLVEVHTHLDKGHIWPRRRNPDGSFPGALESVHLDRAAHWTADDVRARMDFALRCAYAHGTTAIRTHIDSFAPQHAISWPVLGEMIEAWQGRIALQGACLFGIDKAVDGDFLAEMAGMVARYNGVLGAVTFMVPELEAGLDAMFATAARLGLDLDFHVDETQDPAACSLASVATAALRHRFDGRIVVGHCCSIARQDDASIDRTLDLVAEAGIAVVSLPMCNMYLQDRHPGRTPRWRGITLLHEMKARGIPVMISSDNTRDPFYAYGDLDALEVWREATRIAHLDHPFADWPRAIATTSADVMRLPGHGRLAVGLPADLILARARSYSELMSRPQSDRTVLRGGSAIDGTLPDYAELDALMRHA